MIINGKNLCEFCFEPLSTENMCTSCGLSHDTYLAETGLLLPGTWLLGKYVIGMMLDRDSNEATYLAYSTESDGTVVVHEYYPRGIATRERGEEVVSIVSDDKKQAFIDGAKLFFEESRKKFDNDTTVYEPFYANGTVYYLTAQKTVAETPVYPQAPYDGNMIYTPPIEPTPFGYSGGIDDSVPNTYDDPNRPMYAPYAYDVGKKRSQKRWLWIGLCVVICISIAIAALILKFFYFPTISPPPPAPRIP